MTVIRSQRPVPTRRGSLPVVCETFSEGTSADRKQRRTKYTGDQREALEAVYNGTNYPSTTFKRELALQLELTNKQVQIWFQNRRSKDKLEMAAAGLPLPSRRRNTLERLPITPTASTSSSSSMQRSYTDSSLTSVSSVSSLGRLEYPSSVSPSHSFTHTAPHGSLLPSVDFAANDDMPGPIPEEVLQGLRAFSDSMPSFELEGSGASSPLMSPIAFPTLPRTPQSEGPLQRTHSMPAPTSCPTIRPMPRRHATSSMLDHRPLRPAMISFQSYESGPRFGMQTPASLERPATSAGYETTGRPATSNGYETHVELDDHRPGTSAGLVTLPSTDRPSTPPLQFTQGKLGSPIAFRSNHDLSGLSLTRPQTPPMNNVGLHLAIPSPAPSGGPSPVASEWGSVSSFSSHEHELPSQFSNSSLPMPISIPRTPLQIPTVPTSHYAPFSPTGSVESSSPSSSSSFASYMYDPDSYDPSPHVTPADDEPFMMGDLAMMVPLPERALDFDALMDDFPTPSQHNPAPDWSTAFAQFAIRDGDQISPVTPDDMHPATHADCTLLPSALDDF